MSIPKYIEREAVLRILRRYSTETGCNLGRHSGVVDEAMAIVEQLPASEVRPVIHGEWCQDEFEFEKVKHEHEFYTWYCSVCIHKEEYVDPMQYKHLPFYCPNCGAKMEAGVNDKEVQYEVYTSNQI